VKRFLTVLTIIMVGLIMAGTIDARKKKKNIKAYLSGTKISIVEGRAMEALTLLDTVAAFYGPHAQALSLRSQIYVDLIDGEPNPDKKKDYVQLMVTYADSLKLCCENDEIEKKYKKDCDKYLELTDSTKIKYWREFYNLGVEQLTNIEELVEDLRTENDSTTIAYLERDIMVNIDSVQDNMDMALAIDSTDHRPYVAIGNAWERKGDYQKAIDWMLLGLEKSTDSLRLLLPLAYNHIKLDDYCGAIPYYNLYCDKVPTDTMNLYYLSVCYSNCSAVITDSVANEDGSFSSVRGNTFYIDSAMTTYRKILELDPNHIDVLKGAGRYFFMKASQMSDSASYSRSINKEEDFQKWNTERDVMFDSARVYFKTAYEMEPDDMEIAEQYAFACALLENCEEAIIGYIKVSELAPDNVDNWTWLGDCQLRMKKFDDAVTAYENVVRVNPYDKKIWENLAALYKQVGNKAKETEAKAKIKEL